MLFINDIFGPDEYFLNYSQLKIKLLLLLTLIYIYISYRQHSESNIGLFLVNDMQTAPLPLT